MLNRCLLFVLLIAAFGVQAEPVQLSFNDLKVNAEYNNLGNDEPVFVILHGTWMHHETELPMYFQDLLDYEGYSTLNISLSLGSDNRESLIDCEQTPTIAGSHGNAVEELKLWFDWLAQQGHDRFVLLAHSRGGAQASLFWQTYEYPGLERLILLAPATHEQSKVKAAYEERYSKNLDEQIAYFKGLKNQTDPITETAVLYCTFAKVSAEAFLAYYTPEPNKHTPSILADIDVPTMVFLGTEDYLSHKLMEYEDEFSGNDNVSTYWIDGADHFFRDLYSDEVLEEALYAMP